MIPFKNLNLSYKLARRQCICSCVTGTRHWLAEFMFCLPFQLNEHAQMSKEIKMGSLLTVIMLSHLYTAHHKATLIIYLSQKNCLSFKIYI